MPPTILRVATYNNFNFSPDEITQLNRYKDFDGVFVNSNSYPTITGSYPCFICVNSDLSHFEPPKGDLSLVKALRVKYVDDAIEPVKKTFGECVTWAYSHDIPILLTYMRFRHKEAYLKYTRATPGAYRWDGVFYRQTTKKTFDLDIIKYCDLNGKGCVECGNCGKLSFGYSKAKICSINLSSSGACKFNCVDCFVKNFTAWRHGYIAFDKVTQNIKLSSSPRMQSYRIHMKPKEAS
jgi:hypothetical protein